MKALYLLLPLVSFCAGWALRYVTLDLFAASHLGSSPRSSIVAESNSPPVNKDGPPISLTPPLATEPTAQAIPQASLRESLGFPSALHRLAAFAHLMESMRPGDFPALRQQLLALGRAVDYDVWKYFYGAWARTMPELAAAAALADGRTGMALRAWAESDPRAALAWFDAHPCGGDLGAQGLRSQLLKAALPKPGQFPPEEAVRLILELRPAKKQFFLDADYAISAIMRDWATKDPDAAWRGAQNLGAEEPLRKRALSAVLNTLAATDSARALSLINQLPNEADRISLTADFAFSYACSAGLPAALQFARAMPEGEIRRQVLGSVSQVVSQKDAATLDAFMNSLTASDFADPGLFAHAFGEWAGRSPSRAMEMLLAKVPPDFQPTDKQQESYQRLFAFWSFEGKEESTEYLLKLPPSLRREPLRNVVVEKVSKSGSATAEWAAALPDSNLRGELFEMVATEWAGRSLSDTANWLDSLPAGPNRASAVEGFTRTFVSTNPDDALVWLRSIPDEKERLLRLQKVWNSWSDQEAALRWRDSSNALTTAERNSLSLP